MFVLFINSFCVVLPEEDAKDFIMFLCIANLLPQYNFISTEKERGKYINNNKKKPKKKLGNYCKSSQLCHDMNNVCCVGCSLND